MDRRQRKTREAIFAAFTGLLAQKDFGQITVGEIIERADVGRATFYAHFETKELLLKAFCEELFCHIFDAAHGEDHRHIFDCTPPASVFTHLLQHLQKNDNNILALLSGKNNALFWEYFHRELVGLVESQLPLFDQKKPEGVPEDFWRHHIVSTFTQTLKWWVSNGMAQSPETVTDYFFRVV